MKRTHGNEEKWKVVLPRPAVDRRDVIYGLTSPDCTSAHTGVTENTCGEATNKLLLGNEEKWKVVLPRHAVDRRDVIDGVTSPDCTTAPPGVTMDTCGETKNKHLLAAGLKGTIGINDYSYFFKSRTMTGLRTRILHHVMHSKCSGKLETNKAKRKHSKQQKLELIQKYEPKTVKMIDTKKKNYFVGLHDTSNIRRLLEKNKVTDYRIDSVHSLEIIDSKEGAIMDGVFTLIPRVKGIHLTSTKRNTFEAFESLRQSGRVNNSRGNDRTPMTESPNNPPYITVGHYAKRAAPGTADSMKNITSIAHKEITRLFHVIERLSLEHIPFDEVQGFSAAKNMGGWKAFPTAKDMDKRTKVFASMSSGLNVFLPVHKDMDFFYSTTTVIKRGLPKMDDAILNYFCFPEQGVCVALRNYDILLFNPQKMHCVSSRKDPSNDKANDIYCVSFYLKTAVVGGNDNTLDLTVEQEKIVNTM